MDSLAIDVSCPECGSSFRFEPPAALLQHPGSLLNFRCSNCDHRFNHALQAEDLQQAPAEASAEEASPAEAPEQSKVAVSEPVAEASAAASEPSVDKPLHVETASRPAITEPTLPREVPDDPKGHILVRTQNRQRFLALNWEEVGALIEEGFMSPKDKVAAFGGRWKRAESIPELQAYLNPSEASEPVSAPAEPAPEPDPISPVEEPVEEVPPVVDAEPDIIPAPEDPASPIADIDTPQAPVTDEPPMFEDALHPEGDLMASEAQVDADEADDNAWVGDAFAIDEPEADAPPEIDFFPDVDESDTAEGFDSSSAFEDERLDTDVSNMLDGIFGGDNENPFGDSTQPSELSEAAPENDFTAALFEDEPSESGFKAPAEADFSAAFDDDFNTDEFLDGLEGAPASLEFGTASEAAPPAAAEPEQASQRAYDFDEAPEPVQKESYASGGYSEPPRASTPASSNASYPSAISPIDDDEDSRTYPMPVRQTEPDSQQERSSGPDYPVDAPDYPVDVPDYPVDDQEFEDFESYQKSMNRRMRLFIGAILIVVTPIVYFLYPTIANSPTLMASTDDDVTTVSEPTDEEGTTPPEATEADGEAAPENPEASSETDDNPTENIEEAASGADAAEGDAVTGLSDTNNASEKDRPEAPPEDGTDASTEASTEATSEDAQASDEGAEAQPDTTAETNSVDIQSLPTEVEGGAPVAQGDNAEAAVGAENAPEASAASDEETTTFDPAQVDSLRLKREGWIRVQQQRYDEAEQIFAYAIDQDPEDFHSLHGLGWAYQEQGKTEEAKNQFCRLVSLEGAPLDLKKECTARVKALDMSCD